MAPNRPTARPSHARRRPQGCRRDTRELYLIKVAHNIACKKTLDAPDARFFDADRLPYEIAIDELRARRRRRPRQA